MTPGNSAAAESRKPFLVCAGLLALVLAVLFWRSFTPDGVVFANDGPLGYWMAEQSRMPATLTGWWSDLNWLGGGGPSAPPSFASALRLATGPVGFSKLFCPVSLFVLGICAFFFFRRLKLAPLACVLGGLAAMLNGDYFSNACWGQESRALVLSVAFLALAALQDNAGWRSWVKTALAGMAVGMGIMEGFDIGAMFSLFVGAYVLVHALISGEGSPVKKSVQGCVRLGLVAAFAAFMGAQTISALVGTQIKGVVGMEQTSEAKERRWAEATEWSLPKVETLGLTVPGLFGYRMDTPANMEMFGDWFQNGQYWGADGRDPAWDRYFESGKQGPGPQGLLRHTGNGFYAGVAVAALALWALLQSFRRKDSPFTAVQRKFIWFWAGVALVSLLLGFGRFAPFYQFFYALPYVSTIRNPDKFILVLEWALLVLFAYGVHGLVRSCMEKPLVPGPMKSGWARAGVFDRKWIAGLAAALVVSLLAWLIYASSRSSLETHLQEVAFSPAAAASIAGFSIKQIGWFVLFLALTLGAMALIVSGRFAGRRAKWGGVLLGLVLVADLARASLPWIIYWDYPEKYATNPVIDLLRQKPHEQRVTILNMDPSVPLKGLYDIEWQQHLFLYYNIQCLDIIQLPRTPEVYATYECVTRVAPPSRRWQLTNTRYLLGFAAWLESINQQLDPVKRRFQIAMRFDLVPKPGVQLTAVANTNGQYALFEFTGALPRAKLYTNWRVSTNDPATVQSWVQTVRKLVPKDWGDALAHQSTNDQATLQELTSPAFDPEQTVLLAGPLPALAPASATNQDAGTVDFESYAPKHVVLKADAKAPAILLLNDSYDPNWQVTVDGKPGTLLRCNYLMRAVQLAQGPHTVEFRFVPPNRPLYVSLAAIALGCGLIGILIFSTPKPPASEGVRNKPSKPEKPRK